MKLSMIRTCPQCHDQDEHCHYCDGTGEVCGSMYDEWHRQNTPGYIAKHSITAGSQPNQNPVIEQGHTPGPWHASSRDIGGKGPCWKVYSADRQEVATVGRWDGKGDEANARLIASAPAMAEALAEMFKHCAMVHNRWGDNSNRDDAEAAMEKGRAALRAAGLDR